MTRGDYLTIGPVASRLGIPRWQLAYLIERGDVPGPSVQVPGRRLFTEVDIGLIREAIARRQAEAAATYQAGRLPPTTHESSAAG